MRLTAEFTQEKEAFVFSRFLRQEKIPNLYESVFDQTTKQKKYCIWVEEEDDLPKALEHLEAFRISPQDPKYQVVEEPQAELHTPTLPSKLPKEKRWVVHVSFKSRRATAMPLTFFLISLCAFLFLWNEGEEVALYKAKGPLAVVLGTTPLEKELLFDYPSSFAAVDQFVQECPIENVKEIKDLSEKEYAYLEQADKAPSWKGVYGLLFTPQESSSGPLFEKIRQGEVWRLFSPALLHRDFLHILFNMAWLWMLGRQIEERIKKSKMVFFILIVGIVSNVAQYLMSGPYFIGFSGVVAGMVGFIWMRQKMAPWEGYPLSRATVLFVFFFVLAIGALEVFSLLFQIFAHITLPVSIANTAHIVGALTGIGLARLPFFARRSS